MKTNRLSCPLVTAAALMLAAGAPTARAQEIVAIPTVDGYPRPSGIAVSGDGVVVAGDYVDDADVRVAFRWTSAEGLSLLLDTGGDPEGVRVGGVNEDGRVISGVINSGTGSAFWARWIGGASASALSSGPRDRNRPDVNGDGTVLAGRTTFGTFGNATRWVEGTGFQDLGTLTGGFSSANDLSVDGTVVVGLSSTGATAIGRAFRWTPGQGMIDIGTLPGDVYAAGRSVSGDGQTIFADSWAMQSDPSESLFSPFSWTQSGGAVALDILDGAVGAVVDASSFDGAIAAGRSFLDDGTTVATVWTGTTAQTAEDYFAAVGVDLTGWTLTDVQDVSYAGSVMVGRGMLDGVDRHFVVNLTGAFPLSPSILSQPDDLQFVDAGARVELRVLIDTGTSPSTFQWRRNGEPLLSGGPYAGVDTDTLVIEPATAAETDRYDVVVTNDVGSVTSDAALIAVRQPCLADFDGDGTLTIFDFLAFQNDFAAGCP